MPIDDPAGPMAILGRWRKAQRQLEEAAPGSPDHDRLSERVLDLAAEYRAAVMIRVDAPAPQGEVPVGASLSNPQR